ncbi:hypothetical protein [Neobacillus vireti]|uniref:GAP1-N2 domain-containing protein n=1 Tax=Neobacillus vireti TaxID=220686 RepID=UPI002FFF7842
MSGKAIQQQIYTRERGGIFLSTDGYDTVAISKGVEKDYVKKYLHPFCIYHSPKALATRGEKDASLYPEAVTLFQPETGDLVIGQAIFVPADFTGQRSAYFMHNYIVPPSRKEEWIKAPSQLFQISDFSTSYNTELGKVLPDKDTVTHDKKDILSIKDELLEKLGLSEESFIQLLFAVMSSIAGKKKVFISLNVPVKDYTKYALQLLEMLLLYLPYAHRRKIGALTFTSEPESKNYINVIFYEPGTLNTDDRSIEKQFIFDFTNSRISGVDITGQKHEYLDFAVSNFSQSKRIDDFFEFAEAALSGLPEEQKLEITSYYQLTDLYLTLKCIDTSIYSKNKIGFLSGLVKFLQVNTDEKPTMVELFLKLLNEEKVASDSASALDYILAVLSINKMVKREEALSFILRTLEYHSNKPLFHQLWKNIEQDKRCHEDILNFINQHAVYDRLLELYLDERFRQVVRTEDILRELKVLLGSQYLLEMEKFRSVVLKKVEDSIKRESNSFKEVLAVREFKMDLGSQGYIDFKQKMFNRSVIALLNTIRPNELTTQDIKNFGKIFIKPINVKDMKDGKAKENYLISDALYQLLSNPSQAELFNMNSLSKSSRNLVKDILQKKMQSDLSTVYFPLLSIAFGVDNGDVEYDEILKHLIRYSDDKTVLSYIKLNPNLIGTKSCYRDTLKDYIISNQKNTWKNKAYRKELEGIRHSGFKNFLKEIEMETASPVVKFLRKNGLKLMIAVVILGGAGGGTWFGIDFFFK